MAKYIAKEKINKLKETRDEIFVKRNRVFEEDGIDLLDNDTLSSLSVYEIVSEYDPDFNVNFARNGEDGISNDIISEHKCSNINPSKKGVIGSAKFQFHAMGKIDYPRYILFVRNKKTLELVRMYDISSADSVKAIVDCLQAQSDVWLAEGKKDHKKMKRDVIYLSEEFIKTLTFKESKVINNCAISIG
jgi:hypothetical protein